MEPVVAPVVAPEQVAEPCMEPQKRSRRAPQPPPDLYEDLCGAVCIYNSNSPSEVLSDLSLKAEEHKSTEAAQLKSLLDELGTELGKLESSEDNGYARFIASRTCETGSMFEWTFWLTTMLRRVAHASDMSEDVATCERALALAKTLKEKVKTLMKESEAKQQV